MPFIVWEAAMKTRVFVDGQEGTTGLRIHEYLAQRADIEVLRIDADKRKDSAERARLRIAEIAAKLRLEHCERLVHTGNIKAEVVRIAQTRAIDLIVIGSRERHGVSILVNFTEDTVLHAAPCDVLAVRLHRD